jgi:hypothetical protein
VQRARRPKIIPKQTSSIAQSEALLQIGAPVSLTILQEGWKELAASSLLRASLLIRQNRARNGKRHQAGNGKRKYKNDHKSLRQTPIRWQAVGHS